MIALTEAKKKAAEKGINANFIYNKSKRRYEVVMPSGHIYKSISCFEANEL